jgi:hypothetical protein
MVDVLLFNCCGGGGCFRKVKEGGGRWREVEEGGGRWRKV